MRTNNILLISILLILIVYLIYHLRKYQLKKDKTKKIIEDRLRDDALNRAIANQVYEELGCELEPPSIPYEVDYSKTMVELETNKDTKCMLMIIEHSELSERKFIIELKDTIYIGCRKDKNIIINSKPIIDFECSVFRNDKNIYIRPNMDTEVTLTRRGHYIYIQEQSEVKIKNGDIITIKGTVLELKIVT